MANGDITPVYFLSLFDEFKKVPAGKVQAFIDIASGRVPVGVWRTNTQYARALLTAHMLTISGRQGGGSSGGAVTQEQVGDLSRSYATVGQPGNGDETLLTTRYGQEFVALRSETIVPGMMVRPSSPRIC